MSRGPNRIDEERVGIDSLVQHLRGLDAASCVLAQGVPKGNDPPDYWMWVGKHRFAVEITSIATGQEYVASCRSLAAAIKARHESDSPVAGTYAVEIFRQPDIPKRGSKKWHRLVANAVTDIRNMAGSPEDSKARLLQDELGDLAIAKWSDTGNAVGVFRSAAKWEGDVRAELTRLLRDTIEKKYRKIQKKGVMDVCPNVILVLYDAYGYGDIEASRQALSNVEAYDWLHLYRPRFRGHRVDGNRAPMIGAEGSHRTTWRRGEREACHDASRSAA